MAARGKNRELYRKYLERISEMYSSRADIRMFTEIILSAIAVIVFFSFAIRPTLTTIAGLWKEIQSKEDTVSTMERKIENLEQAARIYENQRVNISLLNQAIPDTTSVDVYSRQIEGLAGRNGLVLQSISAENVPVLGFESVGVEETEVAPSVNTDYYLLSFVVAGNFDGIENFMEDFERMRRPALPEVLSVGVSRGRFGEIDFSVTALVPYLFSEEGVGNE